MSKCAEFVDAYAAAKRPQTYSQWASYVSSFSAPNARTWNFSVGDFWGGLMIRFDKYGRWPTIEELFQTNQEHRFLPLKADQVEHWQRKIPNRPLPQADPRYAWGSMIFNAYKGDTPTITKGEILSAYPYRLKEIAQEENAMILAQELHPDPSSTAQSDRKHAILEELESSHHDCTPDWKRTIAEARVNLTKTLIDKNPEEIMRACQEHHRTMAEMWEVMNKAARDAYVYWHEGVIREQELKAKLIDILASLECLKIPLRCSGCSVCQEEGIPFNGSSPRVFQDHCKRKHKVEFQQSIDPLLLTCSRILKKNMIMKTFGYESRQVNMPVPICYHPHCEHHAPTGQTIRHHVECDHQGDPRPNMGMWDYFVSHIQLKAVGEATVEDLLGEHQVFCCSLCGSTSAIKGAVKHHLQQCKRGQGQEWTVTMKPVLAPGVDGTGKDDQDEDGGKPEEIREPKAEMSVEELNEPGQSWLRTFTGKTREGVQMGHPTHHEAQSIKRSQELACDIYQTINPLYLRFVKCDFPAKEGAMEYCWHLISKKIGQLCNIPGTMYGPKRALTPE
jgi:hypothetical protein